MLGKWSAKPKLGVALVLLATCLLAVWLLYSASSDLSAQLRAEAAQLALYVAPPELPDENNAARAYEEALREFGEESSWTERQQQRWNNDWTGGNDTLLDAKDLELHTFLAEKSGAIKQFREAGRKPGCRFERDYVHPNQTIALSEILRLRQGARLLALDARFQSAIGNHALALEDCRALFAMAEHTANDPLLISLLVAISIDGVGAATLEEVLNASPTASEDVVNVFPDSDFSYIPTFTRSMQMEEAFGLATFADFIDGRQSASSLSPGLAQAASSRFYCWYQLRADLGLYRDALKTYQQLAGKPHYEVQHQWAAVEDSLKRRAGRFSNLSLLGLQNAQEAVSRADARRRLVRLALAAHRFQRMLRRLPDELSELTPGFIDAIPLDPFDGKPLRMIQTDSGLVLYSVDADMGDSGGIRSLSTSEPGDISFHVRAYPYESTSN